MSSGDKVVVWIVGIIFATICFSSASNTYKETHMPVTCEQIQK